ncbi:MAG TPA: ABC transporter permease subunit [Saprospiraceae bacterium]|nr:ABC transporter permease subunit [Saprospiraceae bacterium]
MKLLGGIDSGTPTQKWIFGVLGACFTLLIWILATSGNTPFFPSTLPSPFKVFRAIPELVTENELFKNLGFSIGLNLSGYLEAIAITIPVGFIIGLFSYTRWGFQRQVDAFRYVPLTALTGVFIVLFGIGAASKIHFLALGILIYLLPVMVQRIDEVNDVYLKTVHTLGATNWQIIKTVYIPSVLSRLSDDIRVLTAISWTYIIVAEMIASQGGIGALIYAAGFRQGRFDKVFALLVIIMIIGVLQDKIFQWLDRQFFPHKYQARDAVKSSTMKQPSFGDAVGDFALMAFGWIMAGLYFILMINEYAHFLGDIRPLSYLFGETLWTINTMFYCFLLLFGWKWSNRRNEETILNSIRRKSVKS